MSIPSQDEGDDDVPVLSADTLRLLQDFQSEKDTREKQFQDLKANAEAKFDDDAALTMDAFAEDWQVSQFWYSDETAQTLARQLLDGVDADSGIAVVSAPSVYVQLRKLLKDSVARPRLVLLEIDQRFEVFGSDFVPYDFQNPLKLPADLKGKFDRIICDPPFLSDECQTRTALTVRYLSRSWTAEDLMLISCTGERMNETMLRLYGKLRVKPTDFEVRHSKGLSNEFRCYSNFECSAWQWV
ncbi:Protein-lysine N-methyltransferase efm5 [Oleoguttula sp. CCFEE 5521]